MSDADNGAAPQAQAQPKMQVLGQFIRDLSFENIVAQKGASGDLKPDVQVRVSLDARKREADNTYEVITKYNVTSKNKDTDDVLFALELDYGGLFRVEGVPEQQLHPYLLIECPRMLFPFVRRIVADITRDGGFPALNLDTVDFMAIYRQELERRQKEQGGDAPAPAVAET